MNSKDDLGFIEDDEMEKMELNNINQKYILFDDVLEDLGKFGRYQKFLYLLIVLPGVCVAFPTMSMAFTLGEHKHRCAIDNLVNDTFDPFTEGKIIVTENGTGTRMYSKCTIVYNSTEENRTTTNECSSWIYDTSIYQTTIISDFNMVCDNVILQSHASMTLFAGSLIGGIILKAVADIKGRKPVICFSLIMMFILQMVTVWVPDYISYVIIRFLYGAVDNAYWGLGVIMALELVHPSKRELAGVSMNYFWCFGEFILSGLAYWLRNWRDLQLATALPFGLFIGYYFLIEESPRWLLAKGRDEEAHVIIRKIAKYNKVNISEGVIKAVHDPIDPNENISLKMSCMPVLKSSIVMLWITIVFFNFFVIYMGYYGISLNVDTIGSNVYLDFFVSSMVELGGYVICYFALKKVGRRTFHCTVMIVGGIACLCTIFTVTSHKNSPKWVILALSMVGKLGVSGAFGSLYIITAEISPTPVRSLISGFGSTLGQIGSMIAPYVAEIHNLIETDFGNALPLIIYGALMFAAGLAILILPETNNQRLPDTVKEAQLLKRNRSKVKDKENVLI